ncbi:MULTISPECIES: SAM-dependent methyltransferase [unclassified Burkholderia]|uniref:SAM-dependent methyltransferase n=1 Tax=unclassified Burkholderia TaxID=2613784 RepID=UPI001199CAB8|nr:MULTISPECIES: SAM-dependent methyltransferase [unclassified Burkholderia]TWC59652.1 tRNA-Thr(GGU) m(6)t(6)A37 methyltransferase TsaA [Burkholderia sp. SJZ089]TWC94629.1 tRNA-Thr(GGU) m(6)t(6)A37 methyltransferase TsaA [Burkholderia sp. SJZ115]TWC96541.1 tRNA-Thr(GGU) m(6)t(6)A37 methyltransferase TsaA [Burkholderia sp. SJZ091]
MSVKSVVMVPIGTVASPRVELIDDHWGAIESTITIDSPELGDDALLGLDTFSHIEVIYHLHRVPAEEIERGARHPRGREDWPKVGILAQRSKGRPNLIGVSRCQVLSVSGRTLRVRGLDAVDGTPVLDIKPYLEDFGPRGTVSQPAWSREVMKDYYTTLKPVE